MPPQYIYRSRTHRRLGGGPSVHDWFNEAHVEHVGTWPSHFAFLERHCSQARDTRNRFGAGAVDIVDALSPTAFPTAAPLIWRCRRWSGYSCTNNGERQFLMWRPNDSRPTTSKKAVCGEEGGAWVLIFEGYRSLDTGFPRSFDRYLVFSF